MSAIDLLVFVRNLGFGKNVEIKNMYSSNAIMEVLKKMMDVCDRFIISIFNWHRKRK